MPRARFFARLLARIVRSSALVDSTYTRITRLRSRAVLRWAPDGFYDAYNDIAYPREPVHREGTSDGAPDLSSWERRIVDEFFPSPPATILVGGAGTGREALALASLGYRVTAFEPAASLLEDLRRQAGSDSAVVILEGRYEDLPYLRDSRQARVDLAQQPAFEAAIFGWGSFSHLRSDADCTAALRQVRALTAGPIVLSYLPGPDAELPEEWFSIQIGYFRQFSVAHIRTFAQTVGLTILEADDSGHWPYAVLRRPEGR